MHALPGCVLFWYFLTLYPLETNSIGRLVVDSQPRRPRSLLPSFGLFLCHLIVQVTAAPAVAPEPRIQSGFVASQVLGATRDTIQGCADLVNPHGCDITTKWPNANAL